MQAIYNKQGKTIGWLDHKDIYNTTGAFIGFIEGHGVYNAKLEFCGSLKQSVFRDIQGLVAAFMNGAKGVSHLPSLKPSSREPIKKSKPLMRKVGNPPLKKPFKAQWSKKEWELLKSY